MVQTMLYSIMLTVSIIFMQMNHPLAMGLTLLIQTTLICAASGMMAKTFWFSYVLFLIFLGGMLVLFIYVTSLASNEMFSLSMKLSLLSSTLMALALISLTMTDKSLIYVFTENNEALSISEQMTYIKENTLNLNKLYNFPTNLLTLMLINYLLITLIAIVKITNAFYGPLRQMQ